MKVKYIGMHDAVVVPDAGMLQAERGVTYEIEDEVAEGLLRQGAPKLEDGTFGPGTEWAKAEAAAPRAKGAKTPDADEGDASGA